MCRECHSADVIKPQQHLGGPTGSVARTATSCPSCPSCRAGKGLGPPSPRRGGAAPSSISCSCSSPSVLPHLQCHPAVETCLRQQSGGIINAWAATVPDALQRREKTDERGSATATSSQPRYHKRQRRRRAPVNRTPGESFGRGRLSGRTHQPGGEGPADLADRRAN